MTALDWIRYGIAFVVLASHPPSLFLWIVIHPFSAFWRKWGPLRTYALLSIPVILYVAAAWRLRDRLLGMDLGFNGWTLALAAVCVAAALVIRRRRKQSPGFSNLSGVPELSPEKYPGILLSEGIYKIVRHPRYIEANLWVMGYVLAANFTGAYLVWLVCLPVFFLVVVLEERELRGRFGAAYEEYCRRVPRFLPKFGGRKKEE
ncbi:MAG: isoprenylcysteine carboxylmethyltransferase family protein [Anaerolineales bacterium]|nr:isoprenylcysteine carboxylmethyltransferase family protein [Anaerolineales bacterium]